MGAGKTIDSILNKIKLNKLSGEAVMGFAMGQGLNIGMGIYDYHNSREEGKGVITSAAGAIGTSVVADMMGPMKFLALQTVPALMEGGVHAYEGLSKMARTMGTMGMNKPFYNSTFVDNQQNYTMRQAGMQMAKASKYNVQQAMLGNEASFMRL